MIKWLPWHELTPLQQLLASHEYPDVRHEELLWSFLPNGRAYWREPRS